jgi:seryl-tRNA synthetase
LKEEKSEKLIESIQKNKIRIERASSELEKMNTLLTKAMLRFENITCKKKDPSFGPQNYNNPIYSYSTGT